MSSQLGRRRAVWWRGRGGKKDFRCQATTGELGTIESGTGWLVLMVLMRIFDDFLCVKDQEKFSHVLVVSEINNCDNILLCKCHIVHRCLSAKSTWVFGVLVAEQQRLATTCPHTSSSLKNCNEMKYKNLTYPKTFLLKLLWSSSCGWRTSWCIIEYWVDRGSPQSVTLTGGEGDSSRSDHSQEKKTTVGKQKKDNRGKQKR